jgi:hypothetical protein
MSGLGQSRRFLDVCRMSARPQTADISGRGRYFAFVPTADLPTTVVAQLIRKLFGRDQIGSRETLRKAVVDWPTKIEQWTHSDPADWANESFAIAERAQTEYCIKQGTSCDPPTGKVRIDAAYVEANSPIIREQLLKAGVRLAHLLDSTLGK